LFRKSLRSFIEKQIPSLEILEADTGEEGALSGTGKNLEYATHK